MIEYFSIITSIISVIGAVYSLLSVSKNRNIIEKLKNKYTKFLSIQNENTELELIRKKLVHGEDINQDMAKELLQLLLKQIDDVPEDNKNSIMEKMNDMSENRMHRYIQRVIK